MSPAEVLEALVALCREAGLEVRRVEGARQAKRAARRSRAKCGPPLGTAEASGEPGARSAVCRVRGRLWLVLFEAEGLEEQIAAAAEALGRFAPDFAEGRYLPPAVRRRLGPGTS